MEWHSVDEFWDWTIETWGTERVAKALRTAQSDKCRALGLWHALSEVSWYQFPDRSPVMEAEAAIRRARAVSRDRARNGRKD